MLGEYETMSDTMPPCMEDWLKACSDEIVDAPVAEETKAMRKATKALKRIDVDTLVPYKWGQGKPYNQNLKMGDEGTLCLTGCTCTAMAEIMAYWGAKGYHRGCKATAAYTTDTKKYKVAALPALTVFDYKNFTLTKPTTKAAKNAIAEIMEHVGKAIKSDYEADGTGAYDSRALSVFKNTVRMGDNVQLIKAASNFDTWEGKVYNEIANGRPVFMCGCNKNNKGGHAFVCDGYRVVDDKYHFNWGWDGSYNGWYGITALKPGSRDYSYYKVAIINILPAYKLGDADMNGVINVTDVVTVINDIAQGKSTKQTDINSSGKTTKDDANILIDEILKGGVL